MGRIVLQLDEVERPEFVADRLDVLPGHAAGPGDRRNGGWSLSADELEHRPL